MLLAYLDETYSARTGIFRVGVLLVDEGSVIPMTTALDDLSEWAFSAHGTPWSAEFHGSELTSGTGHWSALKAKVQERLDLFEDALTLIAANAFGFVAHGVLAARLNGRSPYSLSLEYALEMVQRAAGSAGELALVIADEVDHSSYHRSALRHFQRSSTGGWQPTKLRNIIDTIHFAPSDSSRQLQATDLVLYAYQRHVSHSGPPTRASVAAERHFNVIAPLIREAKVWRPT